MEGYIKPRCLRFFILVLVMRFCHCVELQVVPDQSRECDSPEVHCLHFTKFLQTAEGFLNSIMVVHFSAGHYRVSHGLNITAITVAHVSNFTLTGPASGNAIIHCEASRIRFDFEDCYNVTIANIAIFGCGSQHGYRSGALVFSSTAFLTVSGVTVSDSYGYGLMGLHIEGRVSILKSNFSNNSAQIYNGSIQMGGNCLIDLYDISQTVQTHFIIVSKSRFIGGTAQEVALELPKIHLRVNGGGGLAIYVRTSSFTLIEISNCTFINNTGVYEGNALVDRKNGAANVKITVVDSTFRGGRAFFGGGGLHIKTQSVSNAVVLEILNSSFIANRGRKGGGLYFESSGFMVRIGSQFNITMSNLLLYQNWAIQGGGLYALCSSCNDLMLNRVELLMYIRVVSSHFSYNHAASGGGIFWLYMTSIGTNTRENLKSKNFEYVGRTTIVSVASTNFTGNEAVFGSALALQAPALSRKLKVMKCTLPSIVSIYLNNILIINNTVKAGTTGPPAAMYVHAVQWLVIENTTFYGNIGGGLYANSSTVIFVSEVKFEANIGIFGGGLWLDCHCDPNFSVSYIYFTNKTSLLITNNKALYYGGGIRVSESCGITGLCFFQVMELNDNINFARNVSLQIATVELTGNHAPLSGDDIFGVSSASCGMFNAIGIVQQPPQNKTFFDSFFKFPNRSLSSVASSPYRICFCKQNSPKSYCEDTVNISVFSGQNFEIPAVSVGNFRGASPAIVVTTTRTTGVELGPMRRVQRLGRTCENLSYVIKSLASNIQLDLIVAKDSIDKQLSTQLLPATINISVKPCPLGFQAIGDTAECQCLPHLLKAGVTCDINTQTHQCPRYMWIGILSSHVVTHSHCPLGYCTPGIPVVNLTFPNKQCLFNRGGVLCGRCQNGLSLSLGSSQCQKCSNVYILLLLPIIALGGILVVLLLKINLTISVGAINGLIFYANIVHINQSTFFPPNAGRVLNCLSIFIAWLNLDLGIEVCYSNGLTAYSRAWLQFLFPMYVWILAGIMIIGSRYYTKVAKIVGNNAVPVLATLFFLSYAKLLRTVIDTMLFTTITAPGDDTTAVWLLDGNILFLGTPHVYLFLASLAVAVVYVIPFTILVLFAPHLQSRSHYHFLCWIRKLKPLLDAYQGPYKDKFRFWTGFMMVVRAVLFVIFAANTLGDPRVNLLAIVITILVLLTINWNIGQVYKSNVVGFLECFFILNLGIYAAATLFTSTSLDYKQEYLTGISVGASLIVFCCILLYHICLLSFVNTAMSYCKAALCSRLRNPGQTDLELPDVGDGDNQNAQMHQPTVKCCGTRQTERTPSYRQLATSVATILCSCRH